MDVRGHLDLLVLATLRRTGAVHGYGLITALAEGSDGTFDLPEGTVYPALHRLEKEGLIVSEWNSDAGRRRRVYSLTADGRESLKAKTTAWERLTSGVAAVLAQHTEVVA